MNHVAVELRVTSIRSRGRAGGVIFSGVTSADKKYVAKCDYRLMPDASVVSKGQLWSVKGSVSVRGANVENGYLRHERVIEATHAELLRPSGHNLITWMTSSPDCTGVGQVKARKLYDRFGPALIEHIEAGDLKALTEVVSEDVAQQLCEAFSKFKVGATLLWLDRIGVPRRIGQGVINYWKESAQQKVEDNPYVLVSFEADWKKVDEFARSRLGIAEDDPRRLVGALEDVLYGCLRQGHTCLPQGDAVARLARLLEDADLARRAVAFGEGTAFSRVGDLVQPTGMWLIESHIARRLHAMVAGEDEVGQAGLFSRIVTDQLCIDKAMAEFEAAQAITLTDEQRQAVRTSAASHLSLILGGAGTGKTTVLKALCAALEAQQPGVQIYQISLMGRAAQRMAEATGREAMTIASFLLKTDQAHIEMGAVIVVDEASMVDALLMHRLLRHLPACVRLVLVGDPSQLPPIGPGLVLHALAGLPSIPQTTLKVVKRQSGASGIPQVGAAIRAHLQPIWVKYGGKGSGVSFVPCEPTELEETTLKIYEDLGGDGTDYSVQILSITNSNLGSVKNLNAALHDRYQEDGELVMYADVDYGNVAANTLDRLRLCVGDLVIYTENDYTLALRNGSLGKIIEALPVEGPDDCCCRCEFEGVEYLLNSRQIQPLQHAYAITCHKGQGSQFKRVILPIRHSQVLDHALVYTAVTRAIEQVVLVGDLDAANGAILAPAKATLRNVTLPKLLEEVTRAEAASRVVE